VPTFPAQFSLVLSVAADEGKDPFSIDAEPKPPLISGRPASISKCRGRRVELSY
jgi:hypothetical protein